MSETLRPISASRSNASIKSAGLSGVIVIRLLLIATTVAAYFPILFNRFVGLDDQATVFENWNLTHLSASSFFSFWTEPQGQLYTPLTYDLFAVISLVARIKPRAGEVLAVPFHAWPFHAVSLVLHLLTVLIVYRLLRRLVGCAWPCAAGALLFALHPVQVESVAWVTATNGLLCGLLSLTAILLYLKVITPDKPELHGSGRIRRSQFALATEVFLLAMLAKPLGVIVPALALSLHWRVTERGSILRRPPWGLALWVVLAIPFAIIAR